MKDDGDTRQFSLDELLRRRGGRATAARADAPVYALGPEFWASARVVMPPASAKTPINLRIDQDVLAWFRAQGKGHLSRMNAVLRSYMEAHK